MLNPERVWDYPRPPRLERAGATIRIVFNNAVIVDTSDAFRVVETTHPPTYYLPRSAFTCTVIETPLRSSFCEWKGHAVYWSLRQGDKTARDCAWSYPKPTPSFAALADHLAVYCAAMDACFVDDEAVQPQPGGFYGGWITPNLEGPFKGGPGTAGW